MNIVNKKWMSWGVKIVFFLLLIFLIVIKLDEQQNLLLDSYHLIIKSINQQQVWVWFVPVLLISINWGIEAKKWQLLAGKLKPITFLSAFEGVLTGLSLSFVTPHSFGDYAGRVWQVNHEHRESLLGSIMLGRLAQMLPTLVLGTFGLAVFWQHSPATSNFESYGLAALSLSSFLMVLAFILFRTKLVHFAKIVSKYVELLSAYSVYEVGLVIVWSFLRYFVFSLQFVCVMWLFDVDLSFSLLFAGTSFILLLKSIVPGFNFLTDLGVRGASAILFFELFVPNLEAVLAAAFVIWILNILLPSVIGAAFIFKMRIFKQP